jgi:hypothetical protein
MALFKPRTEKSSGGVEQRVTGATLTKKVEALRDELSVLDDGLRDLVDQQNALHARLDDLEDLVLDLGPEDESFPVFIYPSAN